ncbi:unnamed protein product [Fusarium graminearum]|nr:unnamed protein product [Fusarium graminearum]CAG1975186.1 unnamed protein product [Fusarium graminearum]VTO87356.1 unnamed protein product [Fusarium graminearum]
MVMVVMPRSLSRGNRTMHAGRCPWYGSRGSTWVRNVILASNYGSIFKPSSDVARKVGVESRKDSYSIWHRTDGTQEIDGSFKATGK